MVTYGATQIPVTTELKSKGHNMRLRNSQPDEDVDTAFDFLDNYAFKDESGDKHADQEVRSQHRLGNTVYLSQILNAEADQIPRARLSQRPQSPLTSDSEGAQGKGPGSRYFVPLKD